MSARELNPAQQAEFDAWFDSWRASTWHPLPSDFAKGTHQMPKHWNMSAKHHMQIAWQASMEIRRPDTGSHLDSEARPMTSATNDALCALARYWKLDGDWMTCKGCKRSLIASRDGEELAHAHGCKFSDQHHPWAKLRALVTGRAAIAATKPATEES